MGEVSRRVLGVLLRSIDGFTKGQSVVIGATNRKQDLDHALRSRFAASISYDVPDKQARCFVLLVVPSTIVCLVS
jgi:SpoVK/Ycf46/Vps4 family AAA+-type ATPase